MPSPFPGMDPYLESPRIWPDLHHELISQIRSSLNPHLRPRYVARVELRVYSTDVDDPGLDVLVPDLRVEEIAQAGVKKTRNSNGRLAVAEPESIPFLFIEDIKEARLEIRDAKSGALVTIIELLSPSNKVPGSRGRDSFMEKRRETLASDGNWVEIDLLRSGRPSVTDLRPSDYRVIMYPVTEAKGRYWRIGIRQPLPTVGIPLRGDDDDAPLDLGTVFTTAYDRAAYDLSIDYRREPTPPLSGTDKKWANTLLRAKGLR